MLLGDGARVYARDGQILPGGSRLFHPGLDASVRALADDGAEAFYTGRVAEAMVAAIGEQGDLGHPDLSAYDVIEGKPQGARLGDADVLARGNDLDDLLGTIQALVLDEDEGVLATRMVDALRLPPRRGDTTSAAVVDTDGNVCAVTTSLGLASGVWLGDYGLHLNSMMGEGELLRGTELPGARMGSMMSPLIAFRDDAAGAGRRVPQVAAGSGRPCCRCSSTWSTASCPPPTRSPHLGSTRCPARCTSSPGCRVRRCRRIAEHDEVVIWPGLDSYFGGVAGIDEHGPWRRPTPRR